VNLTRTVRAAVAAGAVGTALLTSSLMANTAQAGNCDPKESVLAEGNARQVDPCYVPTTRPPIHIPTTTRPTTTTTEAPTTTTEAERPTTTVARPSTTMAPSTTTTTAPVVGGATGARPVAAQAAYTG
jgi:hypothetical protein